MSASDNEEGRTYRNLIDRLVHDCREGQGQVGPSRARAALWNQNATPNDLPDQHAVNVLLARLSKEDREVIARILEGAFVGGVHAALVALHEAEIPPFDSGYEGTPFHDFMGRLSGDWEWPKSGRRT